MPLQRIVIIGLGCIGQAILPLLQRSLTQVEIIAVDQDWDEARLQVAHAHQVQTVHARLTSDNFAQILRPWVTARSFVLNLAPSVCSLDIIQLAQACGALYLDTGVEPWDYHHTHTHTDTHAHPAVHPLGNHASRQQIITWGQKQAKQQPTAIVAHGANPGLVSALVKEALLLMAVHAGWPPRNPQSQQEWAVLAKDLQVQLIQISEIDSQQSTHLPRSGEFVNTWSPTGFITECLQNAELGWGSHEQKLPHHARLLGDQQSVLMLPQAGLHTRVRSWSALNGPFEGFLISHNEAFSLNEYLSYEADPTNPGSRAYRPTVYYAYRPCPATLSSMHWLSMHGTQSLDRMTLLKDELTEGIDELGVLLFSRRFGALWYGSHLSVQRARALAPYNSATSLQVASSVLAGMQWALAHPHQGVVESEALDHHMLLRAAQLWWAPLSCHVTPWCPPQQKAGVSLQFTDFLIENKKIPTDISAVLPHRNDDPDPLRCGAEAHHTH